MDKEQKLHIAETLNTQRSELNHIRQNLLKVMCKLDDLEMYVRMLPVEETKVETTYNLTNTPKI